MCANRSTASPMLLNADCPHRELLVQMMDKWSMMILAVLDTEPMRFNAIKRRFEGITQKALTQSLRRLERNGMISRQVITASPIGVQYGFTPLGRSLHPYFVSLYGWTVEHLDQVESARQTFDKRADG